MAAVLAGLAFTCGAFAAPATGEPLPPGAVDAGSAPATDSSVDAGSAPSTESSVVVLQAPDRIGEEEISLLVQALGATDETLVVRVPAATEIELSPDSGELVRLADASNSGELVVVQQDGVAEPDGAAAILSAFADLSLKQPDAERESGEGGELWDRVVQLTGCDPCPLPAPTDSAGQNAELAGARTAVQADLSSATPLETALEAPAPDEGGGVGTGAVLAALALLAAGAGFVLFARRPGSAGGPVFENGHRAPPALGPPGERPPRPATTSRGGVRGREPTPPPPVAPGPRGEGAPAQVMSVLDPDGYVELDRCLVRARWASEQQSAPSPGEWVDVEDHGGRLWAFPSRSTSRPAAGRRA